eukprot:5813882-Pyramimonas_sp.AAC.1
MASAARAVSTRLHIHGRAARYAHTAGEACEVGDSELPPSQVMPPVLDGGCMSVRNRVEGVALRRRRDPAGRR